MGQEAHQVAATSGVSILQSLCVSLVTGVCHLCLLWVTRGGVYSIQPGIATAAAGSHYR